MIEIYTKPTCPYCLRAKTLLTQKGVTYTEYKVLESAQLFEEMKRRSKRHTVPQIFIDGRHIGGCDDLYALDAAGGLDPLLEPYR